MRIRFTKEQYEQFLEDGWIEIQFNGLPIKYYLEVDKNSDFTYFEFSNSKNRKILCASHNELLKLKPRKPEDPSYYRNDPLCPCCGTDMIYKFEYCPKCGQKLDWSEKGVT